MKTPLCGAALLVLGIVGAAWSIHNGWPAAFGRGFLPSSLALHGDSHHVAHEFLLWRGTAIAPPLPLLAVLTALVGFAARGSRLAAAALSALGALCFAGYWGEPMVRSMLWGPGSTTLRAVFIAAALALSALLALVGYAEWRGDRAPRRVAVPA